MLHEILLSLSGHPSPLLSSNTTPQADLAAGITPPERALLAVAGRLSDLHIRVQTSTAHISASHPSTLCRAVASAIEATQLTAFQNLILRVEESVLKNDPGLVGAYGIVPLTAVMGEFRPWVRRMEWLWGIVKFMAVEGDESISGGSLIDRLRAEMLSGYGDVEEMAATLVKAAESAWLQQVSVWVLNGRLPMFGSHDFFVQKVATGEGEAEEFSLEPSLLPSFVTPATAASMLFIGRSLNRARLQQSSHTSPYGIDSFPSKIAQFAALPLPLKSPDLTSMILSLRRSLAENTLQQLLPLSRVVDILTLMRNFFLLGRGEFAAALIHEADERTRNKWRRADHLAYDKGDHLKGMVVKEGEVAAVLARTWGVLVSRQGQYEEEDEQVEFARDILSLHLVTSKHSPPPPLPDLAEKTAAHLSSLSFNTHLFAAPASLSIDLPSPLDMILSHADIHIYSIINAYLLSLRRAHARLIDLWKMTSLRRHHPAPPPETRVGVEVVEELRDRWKDRMGVMRGAWTTASAAIFFLAETEAFLQEGIVGVLWDGFLAWMTGEESTAPKTTTHNLQPVQQEEPHPSDHDSDGDLWLESDTTPARPTSRGRKPLHDPQTLSSAHTLYLHSLLHHLLLSCPSFTTPLSTLLTSIDHLVAHIHRLHALYTSLDLQSDAGVIDAFTDLEGEIDEVKSRLKAVEGRVKAGIEACVAGLRAVEDERENGGGLEGLLNIQREGGLAIVQDDLGGGERYVPARVGGVNQLLMKLDFGTWF